MVTIIFLFTFETSIYLFLGLYVLTLNPKEKINQLFILISSTLILMSFVGIVVQNTSDAKTAQLWFKIGAIGFASYIYFVLIFCFNLTNLFKLKKIYYIILFLPLLYFIIRIIFVPRIVILKKINNIWVMDSIFIKYSFLFFSHMLYQFLYLIVSIILLLIWYKKSKSIRQKRQALIILITLFISLMFGIFDQLIFFHLFHLLDSRRVPGIFSIYFLFWTFGIWYAIVKYRFLSITPTTVSNDIIANVEESIILLDNNCKIITANDKTKKLASNNKLDGEDLSKVIFDYQEIIKEITEILEGKIKDFSCRLHYLSDKNEKILMDTKFSIVKDKFKDNIGIMIIGKEVKEIKQLVTIYKITDREAEIIQDIIAGFTNVEIAENACVTENTIKKHITNIYNKLGVDNKIQLMNLLKDFNLIPEQKAEKTVFLLRKPS